MAFWDDIGKFVNKTVRYTGAAVAAPFVSASVEKKAFGLTDRESKGFEISAKVDRGVLAAGAVVLGTAALGAAVQSSAASTAIGAGAKTGTMVGGKLVWDTAAVSAANISAAASTASFASELAAGGAALLSGAGSGLKALETGVGATTSGLLGLLTGKKAGGTTDAASGPDGGGGSGVLADLARNLGVDLPKALGALPGEIASLWGSSAPATGLASAIQDAGALGHPGTTVGGTPTVTADPSASPSLAGFSGVQIFVIVGLIVTVLFTQFGKKKK